MKMLKVIITSNVGSINDEFELNSRALKYNEVEEISDVEYNQLYAEKMLDENTGLTKSLFNIEVISLEDKEVEPTQEEIYLSEIEDLVMREIELFETIRSNVQDYRASVAVYNRIGSILSKKEEHESESEPT